MGVVGFATNSFNLSSWYHQFSVVLMFANSCVNPFIYAAKYREFQHGVRRLMIKMNMTEQQSTTAGADAIT